MGRLSAFRLGIICMMSLLACGRPGLTLPGDSGSPGPGSTFQNPPNPPELDDWTLRRPVDVDRSWLTEPLSDVPILVVLNSANFDFGATRPGGDDLRFAATDGTLYDYEIDEWNPSGESLVWVTLDSLPPGATPARFWIYYGQPAAPAGEDSATWRASYVGVWHLRGDLRDESPQANHISQADAPLGTGRLGGGRELRGQQDHFVRIDDAPSLNPTAQITVSAWVNCDSWNNGNHRIVQKGNDDNQFRFTDEGNNELMWELSGVGQTLVNLPSSDAWHYLAATYDGALMRTYIDGQLVDETSATGAIAVSGDPLHIGTKHQNANQGDVLNGFVDEVRVAATARSPSWIEAQWRVVTESIVTVGPEEKGTTTP